MTSTFFVILFLSLSGLISTVFLFALKPIFRSRFSRTWQYYIWLVIVLRLLIPFSPKISFIDEIISKRNTSVHEKQGYVHLFSNMEMKSTMWNTALWYLSIVWLVVAIYLFCSKVWSYHKLVREVRTNSSLCIEDEVYNVMHQLCNSMKIHKMPQIYKNDFIPVPMVIGIFHQDIVLPNDTVKDDLKLILHHELIHYKRKDILYKWLTQIAVCIH